MLVCMENYEHIMINDSGPLTSCISSFIFTVKNTTLSTTRVIFPYTAEILNVLVYSYRFYRAIRCFSDICRGVYEADQSTTPTKFYNGNTTPVIFPMYTHCILLPNKCHPELDDSNLLTELGIRKHQKDWDGSVSVHYWETGHCVCGVVVTQQVLFCTSY